MAKLTINEALQKAVLANQAGKGQESARLLRSILKAQPNHPDANHNMGVFYSSKGLIEKSLPYFKTALEANFGVSQFWYSYINALLQLNRVFGAKTLINQARSKGAEGKAFDELDALIISNMNQYLKEIDLITHRTQNKQHPLDPRQVSVNVVVDLFHKKQFSHTVIEAEKLLKKFPKSPILNNVLAGAFVELKNYDAALDHYIRAVKANPIDASIYCNLANLFRINREYTLALELYDKSLEIKPGYIKANKNKASLLMRLDQKEAAKESYKAALSNNPEDATDCFDLGNGFMELGCVDEAITSYKKGIEINPNSAELHNNLGTPLKKSGDLMAALGSYKHALIIKPDYAAAHYNVGITLKALGAVEDAISSYKKALKINPDYVDAHYNLSEALLYDHQFELGFAEHEWRWKRPELKIGAVLDTSKPMWEGKHNQTVFVWREQGIGDEIMFASLIADLRAVSSKVIVECEPRLIALFERSFPKNITFVSDRSSVNEDMYDFHISMGSLSRFFRPSVESFNEKNHKYLCADPVRAETLRRNLLKGEDKKLVGISWKTASNVPNAQDRNISLSDIAQVLNKPGIQLVSLQYGDVADEISNLKTEFGISVTQVSEVDNKNDIDGLASLISACDEVVSTTNVTVHLAGALGADVSVLLPFVPRWIWGKPNSPSTWYRSVKPYRQSAAGEWDNVLKHFKTPN